MSRQLHTLTLALVIAMAPCQRAPAQWMSQASPVEVELRGLSVVSPRVVWASGARGTVVHTTDGGVAWRRDSVAGAGALDLRAIEGTSGRVAHAISIGDSSRIYRTTDGGRTWSRRWSATRKGTFLDAIRFWDARHGVAMSDPVEGRFLVLLTADGGETWREIPPERIPLALPGEAAFAASGSCLAVWGRRDVWLVSGGAAAARVYHSADRGRTWTVHDTPIRSGAASAGAFSVAFRDARHGVVSGGDYQRPSLRGRNLATTSDGGLSWTLVDSASSPAGYRSSVAFVPGGAGRTLVAVGLSGTDLSTDGGATWQQRDSIPYNSVAFASSGEAWAVGPRGRIAWSATWSAKDRDNRSASPSRSGRAR